MKGSGVTLEDRSPY